jgi:hypothetical protein
MNKFNKESFNLKDKYESASDSPTFLKPNLNESSDKIEEKLSETEREGTIFNLI